MFRPVELYCEILISFRLFFFSPFFFSSLFLFPSRISLSLGSLGLMTSTSLSAASPSPRANTRDLATAPLPTRFPRPRPFESVPNAGEPEADVALGSTGAEPPRRRRRHHRLRRHSRNLNFRPLQQTPPPCRSTPVQPSQRATTVSSGGCISIFIV